LGNPVTSLRYIPRDAFGRAIMRFRDECRRHTDHSWKFLASHMFRPKKQGILLWEPRKLQ